MNASATGEQDVRAETADLGAAVAGLRAAGAAHFDSVGWHFMETLAERAAQPGPLRAALQARLAALLQAFQQRFDSAQSQAQAALAAALAEHPDAAQALHQLLASGQFTVLQQRIDALSGAPSALSALSDLVRDLHQAAPLATPAAASLQQPATPRTIRPENPRIGQFRNTLTKISVAKQVTQALDQAPQNAGPINSHMLVLRSLALMRDASPDYLNRFMAYADTLLQLDEAQFAKAPAPVKKAAGTAKAGKAAKP